MHTFRKHSYGKGQVQHLSDVSSEAIWTDLPVSLT
jgi:hypothetical protein